MATKYVLIGNSAASLAAVDGIRKFDKQGEITIINRETGPAYSRVALPYYVAGEMTLDDLLIRARTGCVPTTAPSKKDGTQNSEDRTPNRRHASISSRTFRTPFCCAR